MNSLQYRNDYLSLLSRELMVVYLILGYIDRLKFSQTTSQMIQSIDSSSFLPYRKMSGQLLTSSNSLSIFKKANSFKFKKMYFYNQIKPNSKGIGYQAYNFLIFTIGNFFFFFTVFLLFKILLKHLLGNQSLVFCLLNYENYKHLKVICEHFKF